MFDILKSHPDDLPFVEEEMQKNIASPQLKVIFLFCSLGADLSSIIPHLEWGRHSSVTAAKTN